jgi:hypothetical protein
LSRSYFKGAIAGFEPLFTGFISAIKGTGPNPVPIEQALMTVAVLEGAKRNIEENRAVEMKKILEKAQ